MSNVRSNKGLANPWHEFTITDPRTGTEYSFRLRALSEMAMGSARDFGAKLTLRYVTGGYYDQSGDYRAIPETIALLDMDDGTQEPIETSEEMMAKFAVLERAQGIKRGVFDDAPKPGVYNAIDLAYLAETAWPVWLELNERWRTIKRESAEKKFQPAQSGTPSAPRLGPEADTQE